ncbi:MAG: oxepin-CoA hydrolase, alternative type [Pelagimonas sp.]|uniref:oxepin-CoA hydrolase, alternative type n=1 Tax=Pelagimonas sp. TaxID=2073170 RepID=UPI003D6B34CD
MSVRLEQRGLALIVHNTSAKRGAITPELYQSVSDAIDMASAPDIRCIILTGGAFFCAGGDLRVLATRAALAPDARRSKVEILHGVIRAMAKSPVPIIAAIEGGAAGAGVSLTLACDLIVASEGAEFTAAYVKAGLTPDGGLTHALSRLLPRQMAMEACLLGRPIPARHLADHGVINQLTPQGQALDGALALAQELAQGPAQAQARIRHLITYASDTSLLDQLDREAEFMVDAQAGPEAAEGISAFTEKRKAEFPT